MTGASDGGLPTEDLRAGYHAYLACLNDRAWDELALHVDQDVTHNGDHIRLAGYRDMLERDVRTIPDLRYTPGLLVVQAPFVAARLDFDCSPRGRFLGLDTDGRRMTFAENVFYEYAGGLIVRVWSVIDRAAVERQLATPS